MAKKPPPWWVDFAGDVLARYFDADLDAWPAYARVRVLVAALDAELRGRAAVKEAVYATAKEIIAEWRAKQSKRNRNRE